VKLPNGDRAFVDIRKLRDYCLNPDHPRGRDKARVFRAALGLTADDAPTLREILLRAAVSQDVTFTGEHEYGVRFVIEFEIEGAVGRAQIQSTWLVRHDEDFPRLITCFVR
jgi:Domain of unknown function (DUF6883)